MHKEVIGNESLLDSRCTLLEYELETATDKQCSSMKTNNNLRCATQIQLTNSVKEIETNNYILALTCLKPIHIIRTPFYALKHLIFLYPSFTLYRLYLVSLVKVSASG